MNDEDFFYSVVSFYRAHKDDPNCSIDEDYLRADNLHVSRNSWALIRNVEFERLKINDISRTYEETPDVSEGDLISFVISLRKNPQRIFRDVESLIALHAPIHKGE